MNTHENHPSTRQTHRKTSPFPCGWRILYRASIIVGLVTLMTISPQVPLLADLTADHPRLLLGKDDVSALRSKLSNEPYASMLSKMEEIADYGVDAQPALTHSDYDYQALCCRNAFLYMATGDDKYAQASRKAIEKLFTFKMWGTPNVKGLALYTAAMYVAMSYDMCYGAPSWDEAFTNSVSKALLQQHNVIFENGGQEQNSSPASNWQGLRWSSAGLTLLATDEPVDASRLKKCNDLVARYLNLNLGDNPNTRGWNIEGLGYTFYPLGGSVLQYALAVKRKDPSLDLTNLPGLRMTLWTTYASLITTSHGLLRPDFGDDNPGADGFGCYGFAFAFCPPELTPGLKYWYDRTVGTEGDKSFDDCGFGIISSLLYYPSDVTEKDPLTISQWTNDFIDTAGNGMMVYRNQYKDSSDVVGQIYAKLRGNMGHNGPDALSFRIVGLDTIWAAGGGRYGIQYNGQDTYWRSMNTLYPVDPDTQLATNANSGQVVGTPVINPDGSGHCVLSISENNVGTKNHTRRFLSSFDTGADAAFLIDDTSDNGKFWQLATLSSNKITTSDNTFTITSPAGATLQGTVLYPAKVEFKTGTRPRGSDAAGEKDNNFIHFSSDDGNYLVVLTVQASGKTAPTVSSNGTYNNATVQIGGKSFQVKGDDISEQ
jgi:hypothetical protein